MSWSDAKRPNIAGTHLPLSQQSAELNDKTVLPPLARGWS
jgi:hypothetical protein